MAAPTVLSDEPIVGRKPAPLRRKNFVGRNFSRIHSILSRFSLFAAKLLGLGRPLRCNLRELLRNCEREFSFP